MNTIRASALLLALMPLLSSCSRNDDLENYVTAQKMTPATPPDPLPVIQQKEQFAYQDVVDGQPVRSPMDAPAAPKAPSAGIASVRPIRPPQDLERFPLDTLTMVGTIGAGDNIVGLVMAPDGVVRSVKPGVYVGQNAGQIVAVTDNQIELVEQIPDNAGGWMERPAKIALQ